MSPRLPRPRLRLRRVILATSALIAAASSVSAGALLNITPQPAGGSSGASLPADPNAQPPTIPYLAIRLAPGDTNEAILSPLKVTENGNVLLAHTPWGDSTGSSDSVGYRWIAGNLHALNRPAGQQAPYSNSSSLTRLQDMNDSGVVVGAFTRLDPYASSWVTEKLTYVMTGAFWPSQQATAQILPPPPSPSPLLGGYAPTHIADSGLIHGLLVMRGVEPLYRYNHPPTILDDGLRWSSPALPPSRLGAAWSGDGATPEVFRQIFSLSPSGVHSLGSADFRFYHTPSPAQRDHSRGYTLHELDEVPLSPGIQPQAINDSGRWVGTRTMPTSAGNQTILSWSDLRQPYQQLGAAWPQAINNANDIFAQDASGRVIWKWLPDPANPPAYHYVKHKVSVSIPLGWAMSGFEGRGFTTSGLLTGKIRKTHDDLGQPLAYNQQTTAPVLFVPVEMTWESVGDNDNVSPNKSPVPAYVYNKALRSGEDMPGGGFRIFPDAKFQSDTTPRDTVKLKIKLSPTLSGRVLHARILDVDDPVPVQFDDDGTGVLVLDENDFNGTRAGHDNRGDLSGNTLLSGYFLPSATPATNVIVNSSGIAELTMRVSKQPGDNYRVSIALDSADKLSVLQVEDHSQPNYVEAEGTAVQHGFDGLLSPMLTVWRRLHIEQDTMADIALTGPQKNIVAGKVVSLSLPIPSNPITYELKIEDDSDGTIASDSLNRFAEGGVILSGTKFKVQSSDKSSPATLIVEEDSTGSLATLAANLQQNDFAYLNGNILTYVLTDDDDQNMPEDFALPLDASNDLINDYVRSKYVSCYIELDATQPNQSRILSYIRNAAPHPFHPEGRDLNDSASFWACRLVVAWQPPMPEDGDPHGGSGAGESAPYGEAGDYHFNGENGAMDAFIFMESMREYSHMLLANPSLASTGQANMRDLKKMVIAHEIAHMPPAPSFHNDHNEGGLMADGEHMQLNSEFTASTIARIRKTSKWTQ